MIFLKKIERFFPIFLISGLLFGFFAHNTFIKLEPYIPYFLIGIMTLLFLKIDLLDILKHIKKPFLLIYISAIHLLLLPFLSYWLFQFLQPNLRISIVLLAALPAGVSSAVFTDIMKGKTSLALTIVIITNLLAIISIPFVFLLLSKLGDPSFLKLNAFNVNYLSMFNRLSIIIFLPLLIAKILKKVILKNLINKFNLPSYYNLSILALLFLMISTAISFQAQTIKLNFPLLIVDVGLLFLAFIVFQFIGYFAVFWMKKGEKIAAANATMIMNNILGIVLSIAFFQEIPSIMLYVILSFIPWNVMIILKHWYLKYLP